jgi:hypothetical protein
VPWFADDDDEDEPDFINIRERRQEDTESPEDHDFYVKINDLTIFEASVAPSCSYSQ